MAEQLSGRTDSGDPDESTAGRPVLRGIKLYRGDDAVPLATSGAMSPPVFDPEDRKALAEDGPRSPTVALGIHDTLVFRGEGDEGYSLVRAWLAPHYVLPRHSHSGDCLYYIVEGSIIWERSNSVPEMVSSYLTAPLRVRGWPRRRRSGRVSPQTSFDMHYPRRPVGALAAHGGGR